MRNRAKPGEKGSTTSASESLYYDDLTPKVKEQNVTHSDTSSNELKYLLGYIANVILAHIGIVSIKQIRCIHSSNIEVSENHIS